MTEALNSILTQAGLGQAKTATLQIEQTGTADQQQVQSRIRGFGGEGWICLTDSIIILPAETDKMVGKTVLSAEIANQNKSLHIRQDGSGWALYDMTSCTDGEQLMVEESFLSIKDKDLRLSYETFWKRDEQGTLTPFASRFAGFSRKGENN